MDVDETMERCLNNEAFYLGLVDKALQDPNFDRLKDAVASGDLDKGFEAAHALSPEICHENTERPYAGKTNEAYEKDDVQNA